MRRAERGAGGIDVRSGDVRLSYRSVKGWPVDHVIGGGDPGGEARLVNRQWPRRAGVDHEHIVIIFNQI